MTINFVPIRYARPPSDAPASIRGTGDSTVPRPPDRSCRATLRRILLGTTMIFLLGVASLLASATSLTPSGLALLTVVGLGATLVGEANLRARHGRREPPGLPDAGPRSALDAPRPHRLIEAIDDVLDDRFPASDPPSWTTLRSGPPAPFVGPGDRGR